MPAYWIGPRLEASCSPLIVQSSQDGGKRHVRERLASARRGEDQALRPRRRYARQQAQCRLGQRSPPRGLGPGSLGWQFPGGAFRVEFRPGHLSDILWSRGREDEKLQSTARNAWHEPQLSEEVRNFIR